MTTEAFSDEEIESSVKDSKVLIIDGTLYIAMPVTVAQLSKLSGRTEEDILDIVAEKMYGDLAHEVIRPPRGVN